MNRNGNAGPETAILSIRILADEYLVGTAKEIVTTLRKTALIPFRSNTAFMRGWAERAVIFTKKRINWENESSFIASNIEAGLMKTEEIQ